jgi:hypothetical protein
MNCPRCGGGLRHCEPNARWLRHFICDECCLAFRLVVEQIVVSPEYNGRIRYRTTVSRLERGRELSIPIE